MGTASIDTVLPAPLAALPTPVLLADTERLAANIAAMAASVRGAGVALRPHVKTSKCWRVASQQLAAGAIGFTCSTAAEVTWLRGHGVADLLWAQQPVGAPKVDFVIKTSKETGPLTVALDSVEAAAPLSAAAADAGVTVPYLIEVDTGHGRAGTVPEDAVTLAGRLAGLPGLTLRGIMTHEGHLARYAGDRAALEKAGRETGALMADLGARLRAAGHPADVVSVGSTPGATSTALTPGVTEARPGTYVYYDANQVRLGSATVDACALTVLTRVISTQRDGVAITDAGIKAMSSDTIAAAGSLGIACDLDGVPVPGLTFSDGNEEHGFVSVARPGQLAVGDMLRIVPNHACGTVNMFSRLLAVRDGKATEWWDISARH